MSERRKRPTILCLSRSGSRLREIIAHLGETHYETIPVSSPEEAVAFCAANQVNVIVLDSEFITEDGWTVTQSFRMVAPQLPIVLLKPEKIAVIPGGIDAIASSTELILGTLKALLARSEQKKDKPEGRESTWVPLA
jgi:DNA-binding response OmpR family regulator